MSFIESLARFGAVILAVEPTAIIPLGVITFATLATIAGGVTRTLKDGKLFTHVLVGICVAGIVLILTGIPLEDVTMISIGIMMVLLSATVYFARCLHSANKHTALNLTLFLSALSTVFLTVGGYTGIFMLSGIGISVGLCSVLMAMIADSLHVKTAQEPPQAPFVGKPAIKEPEETRSGMTASSGFDVVCEQPERPPGRVIVCHGPHGSCLCGGTPDQCGSVPPPPLPVYVPHARHGGVGVSVH